MSISSTNDAFSASRSRFEQVCCFMGGEAASNLTHWELETKLSVDVRELVRQLYQDHLDLRSSREERLVDVIDAEGDRHTSVEADHTRSLQTIFGEVSVTRLAYRRRGKNNLYLGDATLNLPEELHSHGLRELSAIESARGSFEEATEAIRRVTGIGCAKRQVELLAARSVVDFEAFYENVTRVQGNLGEVLVLSADGKGIVMRPDALRPATAKAAGRATVKLKTRLSRGEKHNRKRMAEVGAVYDVTPVVRTPGDIIGRETDAERAPAPKAANKWLTASVVDNAASVISAVFDEAQRRDPEHRRTWIALVDGAKHQIDCINAEAKTRLASR